eukprot:gene6918-biopygen7456
MVALPNKQGRSRSRADCQFPGIPQTAGLTQASPQLRRSNSSIIPGPPNGNGSTPRNVFLWLPRKLSTPSDISNGSIAFWAPSWNGSICQVFPGSTVETVRRLEYFLAPQFAVSPTPTPTSPPQAQSVRAKGRAPTLGRSPLTHQLSDPRPESSGPPALRPYAGVLRPKAGVLRPTSSPTLGRSPPPLGRSLPTLGRSPPTHQLSDPRPESSDPRPESSDPPALRP